MCVFPLLTVSCLQDCYTLLHLWVIWLNYSDFTGPGPPNGGLVREIGPHISVQGKLGWSSLIIWPDIQILGDNLAISVECS